MSCSFFLQTTTVTYGPEIGVLYTMDEGDKTAPRTRGTASESPLTHGTAIDPPSQKT